MKENTQFGIMTGLLTGILVLGLVAGIYIFEAGLSLALAALLGMGIMYSAFPRWLKYLLTTTPIRWTIDITITLGTPYIMGKTVTGIFAGIILGIFTTFFLRFESKRLRNTLWFQKKTFRRRSIA